MPEPYGMTFRMNLRQIEAFRAVMLSGTVSRAAELLGITQPAVSRSVSDLEERVGFALFDRVKGRLVPTPEGQLFFRDVDASFLGLDHLRASAARIRDFGTGRIRIASLAALGSTLVPRAISLFRSRHPHVPITLTVASSSTVRDHIAGGRYDIGLAADEVDLSGVDHQVFGRFPGVCAIPARHPLAEREVVTPIDLDGVDYIALSAEDRARRRLDAELLKAGSKPRLVVETIFSSTICALALEGVGVGLVNPVSADGYAERGVVFRSFKPDIIFRSYLLFRPDTQKGELVRRFTAALLDARMAGPSSNR